MSRTRALRLVLSAGLALAALGAGSVSAGASVVASGTATASSSPASTAGAARASAAPSVALTGDFVFHACPAGTPAADACLTDHLSGSFPGLGPVTGTFEVHVAYSRAAADHCQPIDKHGSFVTATGHRLTLRAQGMFCNAPQGGIAAYDYRVVSGGTGHGQWMVPPPASFADGRGSGPEYFFGTLHA